MLKMRAFAALFEAELRGRRRYFQGWGVVGITPFSCYTPRVKQVISGKLRRLHGTVSTLKKWEETVLG